MNFNRIIQILRRYPLAMVCFLVLAALIVTAFIRSDLVDNLSAREAELTSRIRVIEENARRSAGLEEETLKLEEKVEALKQRLFVREERAINTNFFYTLEDAVDIVVSNVTQGPNEDPALAAGGPNELKLHSTIVYDVTIVGEFREILKFLYELDRVDPLIRVSDFQLNEAGGQDTSGRLSARLRVLVLAKRT